ncbi:hypothetical protein [Fusicatenibacter sp.]
METSKILKYLGAVIIIILLVVDLVGKEIPLPLLVIGLCIGAALSIAGLSLERRNKK